MDVSIIYVNYKTAPLIIDSIRSVKEKTAGISYEIIVVDNDSGDDSLARIRSVFPEIACVQSAENIGFGRANNLGVQQAKGDYLFFLNPDTLVKNNAIELLYQFLRDNPSAGACGANLYDSEGKPTTSFSRKYPSFFWEVMAIAYIPPVCLSNRDSVFFNQAGRPLEAAAITGADLIVRRSVWEKVGGFDADFFMNYEETELCKRIRQYGHKIYAVPDAEIIHLEGRASYIKQSRLYFLYEGQYIYFNKVYGRSGCSLIYAITQLKSYIRILQFTLLQDKKRLAYWRMKLETNKRVWKAYKQKERTR